jgi:hypothetical protein
MRRSQGRERLRHVCAGQLYGFESFPAYLGLFHSSTILDEAQRSIGVMICEVAGNQKSALNAMRYIAGVSYNVTNNSSYQASAQAAALVNRVNGG